MPNYKIIGSIWFSSMKGTMGIVAIDSDGGGWKAYIDYVGTTDSQDQEADEQEIAKNGAPVGKAIACASFPSLDSEKFID